MQPQIAFQQPPPYYGVPQPYAAQYPSPYGYGDPNPRRRNPWPPAFWQRASTPRKVAYVGGSVLAVAGVIWAVRWATKVRPFANVSDQCNDFSLADREEINEALTPMIRKAASHGAVDPFGVTTEFVRRYAANCRTYPDTVRNPGEAKLYLRSFEEVLRIMADMQLVSPQQRAYFLEMVAVWAKSQGVPATDLPPPIPSPQGGLGG